MAHRYFTTDMTATNARITGADANHICKVLRMRIGDTVLLCDGKNTDYTAQITDCTPQEVSFTILSRSPCLSEPSVWVDAYIGYAKGERMDFAVQKAVELGASAIYPFFSENTVVKPAKNNQAEQTKTIRLNRIAVEAAKQSGRGILPVVYAPLSFKQVIENATQTDLALFLYEHGGSSLRQHVAQQKRIAIITGAEGGFSPQEADFAGQKGCVLIGLGNRILRCETAPMATLSSIMTLTGNLE